MKKFTVFISLLLILSSAVPNPYESYIKKWAPTAVREMKRSGVPASITLAQGLLESAAGQSQLAREGNNHFGIKCHKNWTGKGVYKDAEAKNECFRAYSDAEESFRDHSDFLRYQDRYKSLFDLPPSDYVSWAKGLKSAGYATDPAYPQKLIKIIEEYKLYTYDSGVKPELESPVKVETPVAVEMKTDENIRVPLSRQLFTINGVPFVYAVEGERLSDIASSRKLYLKEVQRYNDLSEDVTLKAGQPVYLAPKKNSAAAGAEKLIVGPGEQFSLWEISQRYAVKLSSLCKLNSVSPSQILYEGDEVRLRK